MALLAIFLTAASGADAAEPRSRIRLLDGGKDESDRSYLAALEISLDPGYMTYWRTPGEAGLPPVFDWSKSGNVGLVYVRWPAPSRVNEAGSIVYGFYDRVTLPLTIYPEQAGLPVDLKLNLQYGICKEQCIPVEAEARIRLTGAGNDKAAVHNAIAALPEEVAFGDPHAPFAFLSFSLKEPEYTVTLRAPPGEAVQLFIEGPEDWVFSTSEGEPGTEAGTLVFKGNISGNEPDKEPAFRLTARSGSHTIYSFVAPNAY